MAEHAEDTAVLAELMPAMFAFAPISLPLFQPKETFLGMYQQMACQTCTSGSDAT
ncbi:MAG: hypothetical protein HYU58_05110 [Proteobacteria bacterium]|nr:hypothetical protein [Pseudomonadota bacterium]